MKTTHRILTAALALLASALALSTPAFAGPDDVEKECREQAREKCRDCPIGPVREACEKQKEDHCLIEKLIQK